MNILENQVKNYDVTKPEVTSLSVQTNQKTNWQRETQISNVIEGVLMKISQSHKCILRIANTRDLGEV